MANKKIEGQYMTPDDIVTMILDSIGYIGRQVLNKKIIEPSFGDGAFLTNIVKRILSESKKANISKQNTIEVINRLVFGIEKDTALYLQTIEKLNSILDDYEIYDFDWSKNLLCGDTLLEYKKFADKMDYVVGNPPYIRIHNVPDEYRETVKNFRFVDGMLDLYIVFYEIGILMLNNNGKLGYISPNSFMKNTSQTNFRNYLIDNKYISAIYDFKTSKIFEDADTYTCICILDKNKNREDFSVDYREYSMRTLTAKNKFDYEYFKVHLKNKPWTLGSDEDVKFLEQNKRLQIKISDIATVQNGIATNKDAIYIIHAFTDNKLMHSYYGKHTDAQKIVFFKDKAGIVRMIESTILHRCIKASRCDGKTDNTFIIFPYKEKSDDASSSLNKLSINNGYRPLSEMELKHLFPKAFEYLLSFKKELIARNMDKNAEWFLFGRSQGLQNSNCKKIVFKHIINKENPQINPYIFDDDVLVYSGVYTTIDKNNVTISKLADLNNGIQTESGRNVTLSEYALRKVRDIYASDDFAKYCSLTGKDMSGGYISVSTKTIKQFGIAT